MFKYKIHDKRQIVYLVITILLLLLAACGTTAASDLEEGLPAEAVLEAQSWLADQLNIAVSDIEIVSAEQVEWTDSCLGLGGAAEACLMVITPGWRADFEVNGQQYEVRLDETGATFRSPQITPDPPTLEEQ